MPAAGKITPDTVVYFSFDGTRGQTITAPVLDDTGTVTFSLEGGVIRYGNANPLYNSSGTSADFSGGGGFWRDDPGAADPLDLDWSQYTIEMYFMADVIGQSVLIRKYWPWFVDVRPDGLHFTHNGADISAPISPARWYHVAAVFDSDDESAPMKLYLDGELVASGGIAAPNPDQNENPVSIGMLLRSDHSDGQFFDGKIDELRISRVALPPTMFLGAIPTVQFQTETSENIETAPVAALAVELSVPQEIDVTVDYAVTGGSALQPDDYSLLGSCRFDFDATGEVDAKDLKTMFDNWLATDAGKILDAGGDGIVAFADFAKLAMEWLTACNMGTLHFTPGQTAKVIYIDVADDGAYNEPDETVVLDLSNVTGGQIQIGDNSRHTYTIIDTKPTVAFEAEKTQNLEKTIAAKIAVVLSHPTPEPVTVDYAIAEDTATGGGVDFMGSSGKLTFAPGETTQIISVRLRNDSDIEENETILLSLSNPTNASLGALVMHSSIIIDDDAGAWFDGKRWFSSHSPLLVHTDAEGRLEWNPSGGNQMIVHFDPMPLNAGDTVTFAYLWSSYGASNPTCECYKDYNPDPDVYNYCTDITCVGGTGDFRMGLFDSNEKGQITEDWMGENNGIFRGYLGYSFRIFPHVPQDHRSRFREHKTGGGTEGHTNTSIWERNKPDQNSSLLSTSNSYNRIDQPMTGGFGLPLGGSSLLTIQLERTSETRVRLRITCNGKTWSKSNESTSTIPNKIDTFAIWSNDGQYDWVKLALP